MTMKHIDAGEFKGSETDWKFHEKSTKGEILLLKHRFKQILHVILDPMRKFYIQKSFKQKCPRRPIW